MEVLDVQLCVVVQCRSCGRRLGHELPLVPGGELRCECGRSVYVDTETLNRVEALQARYLSRVRR